MTFNDTKTVITPEQVAITFRLAGIGTRFAAMLVDTLAQAAVLAALVGLLLWLLPGIGDLFQFVEAGSPWLIAIVIIAAFSVLWGYFIFFETIWSGRTPGKSLAGIRVICDTGHPIDFRAALLRNICRYVDFLPAGYGVGALVMFFSGDSKRLGDYVAGTVVVVDTQKMTPQSLPTNIPTEIHYHLLGDAKLLKLHTITREQLAVIDRFLTRRETLLGNARMELAQTIATPLLNLLELPLPSEEYPYEQFLEEVLAACRSRERNRA
jgi:uncharacterized RDD family membrane protein YckC